MVMSLRVRKSLRQFRLYLGTSAAVLTVVAAGFGIFMDDSPWFSALVGLLAGLVMFAASWFTTNRAAQSDVPHVGWIALDYVVKVAITAGVLFWAKAVDYLNVVTVGVLLIAAVLLNMVAQVAAFYRSP